MDTTMYLNQAYQNAFLNKPANISVNSNKCVLIYLNGPADAIDLLHDRIKMIAKDGFLMGKKTSNISIIETDLQPAEIRDKLMSGEGSKAEIFVMSFNYNNYAGWLEPSNKTNVESFFKER